MPKLTPEEEKMPLAKFYHKYPLLTPPPLQQQILDAGPIDPSKAVKAQNWLDVLKEEGYKDVEYGYCMMPDGSGYYCEYFVTPPNVNHAAMNWYRQWLNHKSKSMVEGQGNLRYKLWCPVDHWDHKYVNGKDPKDGVYAKGTLDLGKSGAENGTVEISHGISDLGEYGLTEERKASLKAAGCSWRAAYEEVEGGYHLALRLSRPCPFGGTENMSHEWIGYYPKDGKIVRAEGTPCSEEMLKNILIHNTCEHLHQFRFVEELYHAYKDQPIDAD